MMRRPTDIDARAAAIDRLVRAGRAAMPDPSAIAERQLGMVSVAVAAEQGAGRIARGAVRSRRRVSRRRVALVGAMAVLVALPTFAMAGALPDPVQRVASQVAAAMGVSVPVPARDAAESDAGRSGVAGDAGADRDEAKQDGPEATGVRPAGGPSASGDRPATAGEDRGHVNGIQPGAPEDGEQRGNRFGQVPEGPDQGKAGQRPGSNATPATPKPPRPAPATARPATPGPAKPAPAKPAPAKPEPATPAPANPAPATPATPSPAPGANGSGNAGGNGAAGGSNGNGNGNGRS